MYKKTRLHNAVRRSVQSLAAGAASIMLVPGLALAQEEVPVEAAENQKLEEVVVTGSLIRGVAAVGSQTLGLDKQDMTQIGAVTTNELLASIPQVSNFFNQRADQDPRGAARLQVNRPNLRNLPGINTSSGATTLVLVNGHRMAPVGTDQSSVDPDIIPQNVIERVDVVTDGGSSLYGADAVGGVINFLTLKEFEGVQLDLGYDTADDFNGWQGSVLAGTKWDSGSGYISVATTDQDNVKNDDRDWAERGTWDRFGSELTPSGTECVTPVGAVTTWFWYGSGWTDNPRAPGAGVTPVGAPCDIDGQSSLLPEQTRDNVYGGITQEITDKISLDTRAYYMKRDTTYSRYPDGDTVAEPNPTEQGIVGTSVGELYDTSQVGFSYAANPAYRHRETEIEIETWGIAPELTIELPGSWQLRNTLFYGYSENQVDEPASNREKLIGYVESDQLDPLNVAAADASVIDDILDWEVADYVEQELSFIRAIADGDVMQLPAGMMRAAVGLEYSEDEVEKRSGDTTWGGAGSLPGESASRDLTSAFAELSIPVIETLDLSISARYDDYSDFGDTTNPTYGLTYTPTEWLTVFGKWGESFNAPTVLDSVSPANGRFIADAAAGVPDPNNELTDPNRNDVFLLEGASGALDPQTATTWGTGFEIQPTEGLSLTAYYYEIDFKQLLGSFNPQETSAVLLNPDAFIFNPTQAEWDASVSEVDNADQFADINPADVGVIIDRRVTNSDEADLKGMDFGVEYGHETDFGYMTYGVLGNLQTHFEVTSNGSTVDQLKYNPDLYASTHIGWERENVRARLTLNYTDSYDADPTIAVNQRVVDSFLKTNLYVGYDFASDAGIANGLTLSFIVDNLFDEDPPEYRVQRNLNFSGYSLGQVFKLGMTYTF